MQEVDRHGVYPKYIVFHHPDFMPIDKGAWAVKSQVEPGINLKEVDSFTFVLRPDRDYHARVALAAYAESVRHWSADLAIDLDNVLADLAYNPDHEVEPGSPS